MSKETVNKPRKPYAKPAIAIEDFTINQFIAGCDINIREEGWEAKFKATNRLLYTAMVKSNQFAGELDCLVHADVKTSDMDTLCYHTSTSPLFGS